MAVFNASNELTAFNFKGVDGGAGTIGGTPTKTTLNGQPGITFDASGETISKTVGAWGASGVQQTFAVYDQIAQTTGLEGLYHRGSPGPTTGVTLLSTPGFYVAGEGWGQGPQFGSAGVSTNPVIVAVSNGTTQSAYVDGTSQTLDSPTAGTFPNLGSDTYVFGEGWDAGIGVLNGTIFQLLLFDYALSREERQWLEGWGAWKYGLQANLAVGHRYSGWFPTLEEEISLPRAA